jgi:cyanophycinase-like exopeptidase
MSGMWRLKLQARRASHPLAVLGLWALAGLWILPAPALAQAQVPESTLSLSRLGSPDDASPVLHGPALYLKGDGAPEASSFTEFVSQVAHTAVDVVVLGASYPGWEGECKLINSLPQVNSCTTIVIRDPEDASNPDVLSALAQAEVVYFRGGDQCNFMRWRNSPIFPAVRELVQRGGGTGGGSAGLAIQGGLAVYDGCSGSVNSPLALADPYRTSVSFTRQVFNWAPLDATLTDSHFVKRDRMGRLMAFLCRQLGDGQHDQAWGLGVNEGTTVVIDRLGQGTVFGDSAYVVLADQPEHGCTHESDPVNYTGYKVWRLEGGQAFDFMHRPRNGYYQVDVAQGQLSRDPYQPPASTDTLTAHNSAPSLTLAELRGL